MSSRLNKWVTCIYFVLTCTFYKLTARNPGTLLELTPQNYFSTLQPGKASLVYFSQGVSPTTMAFLEQLTNSIEPLQEYGISAAKVICEYKETSKYCGKESSLMKAYLFRGSILLREFPLDALFDVNAIIANVLFALLFNEVKYITLQEDLYNVENTLKGKTNIVFTYVRAVGTPEHRAVMEAAFVYGTTYQFVLTTEIAFLESVGTEETDLVSARLYFFHCKPVLDFTQKCRRTLLEQPLTTLNIHRFLKLMETPLLVEVAEDPEKVSTIHLQLGLPLIFILSRQETYADDKRTAELVAWHLLGKAGVTLLLRDSWDSEVLGEANVILKKPEEGVPLDFLVLQDIDSIIALVESNVQNSIQSDPIQEYEEDEMENLDLDVQDDQVVETVYRDRKRELPLELIVELTEETFNATISGTSDSVVLFYASWEAVSLAFLQSYVDVAIKLKGAPSILLLRINCGHWSNVCTKQNITEFPLIKFYQKGENPVTYTGMLGTEDLLRFILLNRLSCPLTIVSIEEAEEYLRGKSNKDLTSYWSVSVLGLFNPSMTKAKETFIEAANSLKGYVIFGLYSKEDALVLSKKYAVTLPALLLARPQDGQIESIPLTNTSAQDIIQTVQNALLEIFPEITVENLPIYLRLQKPLLILFSEGTLNKEDEKEVLSLIKQKSLEDFTPCWLNLKNTPVGRGILKVYFNHPPALPLLVLVDLPSGGRVFAFPSDQTFTEANILSWLKKLEAGLEHPTTTLPDDEWKPPLPAYNFLSRMDAMILQLSTQSAPNCRKTADQQEETEEQYEDKATVRTEPTESTRMKRRERTRWFKGVEKQTKHHTEL
ncbi:thioredoxin domain-containing protein 16 isoform X1 [Ornithorhynchus anatinus]|uniref:thioredoxin domain-containing protein 16 isoform X1 n=1 Tax=Ornithorhynchus anatinus TaxID=9258 RepID=UPI0004546126|nr:thioredoxin domain-containing protein 16 isoform X1 [Ornithorhynchus anatinus]XP_039770053.1 thioredoxin domain-containing protein 16 isoform X1 [Ornithorhynchus anatinus]